jgi:hypothetical protein
MIRSTSPWYVINIEATATPERYESLLITLHLQPPRCVHTRVGKFKMSGIRKDVWHSRRFHAKNRPQRGAKL